MNILGISGQEKDAAAALVQDGRVVAAIEEEKLARIRHVGMNYAGGLPFRAIEFCLERGGITFGDIDYVAYYLEPHKLFHREIAFNSSRATDALNAASIEDFPPYFVDSLNGLKQRLRTKRLVESRLSSRGKFVTVGHHLAHGASAFYASGFERAAVIAADNRGDMTTTALMTGAGHELLLQSEAQFPNSIGMVYSAVTAALGFGFDDDWHKTMWISPTGENEFREAFNELIKVDANGLPVVNMNFFEISSRGDLSLSDDFFKRVGVKPRAKEDAISQKHRNLAASLQARVEDVLCEISIRHREPVRRRKPLPCGRRRAQQFGLFSGRAARRICASIRATCRRKRRLLYRRCALRLASTARQQQTRLPHGARILRPAVQRRSDQKRARQLQAVV